jgi:hypothetical protein
MMICMTFKFGKSNNHVEGVWTCPYCILGYRFVAGGICGVRMLFYGYGSFETCQWYANLMSLTQVV